MEKEEKITIGVITKNIQELNLEAMGKSNFIALSELPDEKQLKTLKAVIEMPSENMFFNTIAADDTVVVKMTEQIKYLSLTTEKEWFQKTTVFTKEMLAEKIKEFGFILKRDFGITVPKIAVLSAGSGNKYDNELILPAVSMITEESLRVFGLYDAATFFTEQKDLLFDGVVALFEENMDFAFKYYSPEKRLKYIADYPCIYLVADEKIDYQKQAQQDDMPSVFKFAVSVVSLMLSKRKEYEEIAAKPLKFVVKEKEGQ